MEYDFEVGNEERQMVELFYSPFWNILKIKVDGKIIRRDLSIFYYEGFFAVMFLSFFISDLYTFASALSRKF